MSRPILRRLATALAVGLFIAAVLYPFQPSLEQGLLGPLGQMLFFYVIIGWLFILVGVDPTGAGAPFAFVSPWPSLTVLLAIPILFRPSFAYWRWLRVAVAVLAVLSPVVAWRLADPVSTIPLMFWSVASILAGIA